jgi:hypothetical protein
MASLREIAANRRNVEKSLGPNTEEGKARSRENALKHGLAGAGVVLPDDETQAVRQRMGEWRAGYEPASAEEEWLFTQVVVSSVRLDQCVRQEAELRANMARRARVCWNDDRRLAAEETAAGLARKPALIARRLRRSKQGCDWLLERWQALGQVLERTGEWTEAQTALAFDLLGTPHEFRGGRPWACADSAASLVAREVAALETLQAAGLAAIDDDERAAATEGLEIEPSRPLTLLKRYEAACLRRLHWAQKQLRFRFASASTTEPAAPTPEPEPAVRRRALPELTPPTEEEYIAYEKEMLLRLLNGERPEPPVSAPAPTSASAAWPCVPVAPAPRPGNRRMRRAAERLAARQR